jgi:hypothetical protein
MANEQRASEKQRSISSLAIPIKDFVNFDYQDPRLKSQDGQAKKRRPNSIDTKPAYASRRKKKATSSLLGNQMQYRANSSLIGDMNVGIQTKNRDLLNKVQTTRPAFKSSHKVDSSSKQSYYTTNAMPQFAPAMKAETVYLTATEGKSSVHVESLSGMNDLHNFKSIEQSKSRSNDSSSAKRSGSASNRISTGLIMMEHAIRMS